MSVRRGSHKLFQNEHSQKNEISRQGEQMYRTSAPSGLSLLFRGVGNCTNTSQKSCHRSAEEAGRVEGPRHRCPDSARPSAYVVSSRHTLMKPPERQHWAPWGLTPQSPSWPVRAHLSRKGQRNAFSSSACSVNAKKPSLMCLMK